jgi:hypothetical protein
MLCSVLVPKVAANRSNLPPIDSKNKRKRDSPRFKLSQIRRAAVPPDQLSVGRPRLPSVIFDMRLGCFGSVMRGMFMVTASEVSVMRCSLVLSCFVVLGGFLVMACRIFVMFCGLVMMFHYLLRHKLHSFGFKSRSRR